MDPGEPRWASGPPPTRGAADERSAGQVAAALGLQPHREGGFFRETYRADLTVQTATGRRPATTAILYLLTREDPSRFHRLRADEIWFFHGGAPVEMLFLGSGSGAGSTQGAGSIEGAGSTASGGSMESGETSIERLVVGPDRPQALVPAGCWMAARVTTEGVATADAGAAEGVVDWALVGCAVTPGFEYEDFELADRSALLDEFPRARAEILALT